MYIHLRIRLYVYIYIYICMHIYILFLMAIPSFNRFAFFKICNLFSTDPTLILRSLHFLSVN